MNLTEIKKFFAALYQTENPRITYAQHTDKGGPEVRAFAKYGTIEELTEVLTAGHNSGASMCFAVNPTMCDHTGDELAKEAFAVWVDLDEGFIPEFKIPPSAIITREDGKSHHAYWFIFPTKNLEKWQKLQKALIGYCFSDPAIHNRGRVMRIPTTLNRKQGLSRVHNLVKCESLYYTIEQLEKAFCVSDKKDKARKALIKHRQNAPYSDNGGRDTLLFGAIMDHKRAGFTEDETIEEINRFSQRFFSDLEGIPEKIVEKSHRVEPDPQDRTAKEEQEREILESLFSSIYFIHDIKRYCDTLKPRQRPREQSNIETTFARFASGRGSVITKINSLGVIKEIDAIEYFPGNPATYERDGNTYFNVYEAPKIQPERNDEGIKLFKAHLKKMITDPDERRVFKQYVAHMVQNPGDKIKWAVLLKTSKQGTGKSLLIQAIAAMLGSWNVKSIKMKSLDAQFNGHWAGCSQFVAIHETKGGKETYENLKDIIDGGDEIEVNIKNIPTYMTINNINFMFFSNNADPMEIPSDDRRFFVIDSQMMPESKEYYQNLVDEIENSGPALLSYFKSFNDWKGFSPKALPFRTHGHENLANRSCDEDHIAMKDKVGAGETPELVTFSDVKALIGNPRMSSKLFSTYAIDMGWKHLGRVWLEWTIDTYSKAKKSSRQEVYATDRCEYWLEQYKTDNGHKIIKEAYRAIKDKDSDVFAAVEHKPEEEDKDEILRKLMS